MHLRLQSLLAGMKRSCEEVEDEDAASSSKRLKTEQVAKPEQASASIAKPGAAAADQTEAAAAAPQDAEPEGAAAESTAISVVKADMDGVSLEAAAVQAEDGQGKLDAAEFWAQLQAAKPEVRTNPLLSFFDSSPWMGHTAGSVEVSAALRLPFSISTTVHDLLYAIVFGTVYPIGLFLI